MDITIGKMQNRITLQQATESVASDGSVTQTWADSFSAWSYVVPLSGNENFVAQGILATVIYRITMRWADGRNITPKMRITYGSKILDIKSARNWNEKNRWMILDCAERLP